MGADRSRPPATQRGRLRTLPVAPIDQGQHRLRRACTAAGVWRDLVGVESRIGRAMSTLWPWATVCGAIAPSSATGNAQCYPLSRQIDPTPPLPEAS